MKEIFDTIRNELRSDVGIHDLVGLDVDNEVKVYESKAKSNISAPYIVYQVLPGGAVDRAYGDEEAMHQVNLLITAWTSELKLSWQLIDTVMQAMKSCNFEAPPWSVMYCLRVGPPQPGEDRDTAMYQVAVPYTLAYSSNK